MQMSRPARASPRNEEENGRSPLSSFPSLRPVPGLASSSSASLFREPDPQPSSTHPRIRGQRESERERERERGSKKGSRLVRAPSPFRTFLFFFTSSPFPFFLFVSSSSVYTYVRARTHIGARAYRLFRQINNSSRLHAL